MRAPFRFAAPDPVAVSIDSDLPRDEALKQLSDAIAERRYSSPGRNSRYFFRLGGVMAPDGITITARPYLIPGVIAGGAAMTIELRAQVVDTAAGSRLTGVVRAPVPQTTIAFGFVAWLCFVAFGVAGNGSTWPTWTFAVVVSLTVMIVWTWTVRHNQRMALGKAHELTRLLTSILSGRT